MHITFDLQRPNSTVTHGEGHISRGQPRLHFEGHTPFDAERPKFDITYREGACFMRVSHAPVPW